MPKKTDARKQTLFRYVVRYRDMRKGFRKATEKDVEEVHKEGRFSFFVESGVEDVRNLLRAGPVRLNGGRVESLDTEQLLSELQSGSEREKIIRVACGPATRIVQREGRYYISVQTNRLGLD